MKIMRLNMLEHCKVKMEALFMSEIGYKILCGNIIGLKKQNSQCGNF